MRNQLGCSPHSNIKVSVFKLDSLGFVSRTIAGTEVRCPVDVICAQLDRSTSQLRMLSFHIGLASTTLKGSIAR